MNNEFCFGFFREIKIIFHIFRIQWPAAHWPHPPAEMTSTLLPNSLVPELLPSEWPDQEPESDQSSDLLSLVMPEIHPSNNNCFHTPFWDLLCPKLWAFSVLWWPFCSYSPSRKIIFHQKYHALFELSELFQSGVVWQRSVSLSSWHWDDFESSRGSRIINQSINTLLLSKSEHLEFNYCYVTIQLVNLNI